MKRVIAAFSLVCALAGLGVITSAKDASTDLEIGPVELESIGALELGPDNVLFLGDSTAAAVYAVDIEPFLGAATGDRPDVIEELDAKIAALLGTDARAVFVHDMAVHEASGTTFLSVSRGSGEAMRPVLVRLTAGGELGVVGLDEVGHRSWALTDAPERGAKMRNRDLRALSITDIEYVDGEIFVAGLSNEEFASTLRRIPFRSDAKASRTQLEIYHGAHGQYETHAPIYSFVPYELDGKTHLLAGYLCTPLVTFPLDEVRSQERMRGKTIAELGFGNVPIDIVPYEHEGERWVLVANTRRGAMKMKHSDIVSAQHRDGITAQTQETAGVEYLTSPLGNVVQVSDLDPDNILILWRAMDNGALHLSVRAKRWV